MNYTNEELATAIDWAHQQAKSLSGIKDAHEPWAKVAKMLEHRQSQDARIAELTAEVVRLTGLADGMYRCGEALLLAVDTFVATYGSEDVALEDLHELTDADAAMCEAMQPHEGEYIARNALKDGK